jgi:hypothetical protein
MTQNLFKQGYIAPRLKPSLQKLWLSITKYSYLKWQRIFSSLRRLLPSSWINVWITRRVSYKKKEELLSQHEHLVHPWPLVVSILLICLVFMLCFFCVFCSSLSRVPNVASVSGLFILDWFFAFLLAFIQCIYWI